MSLEYVFSPTDNTGSKLGVCLYVVRELYMCMVFIHRNLGPEMNAGYSFVQMVVSVCLGPDTQEVKTSNVFI